jgi:hypothetical protein
MIDFTRPWGCPLVRVDGRPDHCFGCDHDDACKLFIVRVEDRTREMPTYYCASCAAVAEFIPGTVSCRPARTEIVLDQKHYERLLQLYGAVFERKLFSDSFSVLDLMIDALARTPQLQQWS